MLLLFLATARPASLAKTLRAGVGNVDISPHRLPIILSGGFLARTTEKQSGELHARALVLDDGENRIAIAVVDTLMMPRELLDQVKETASRTTGIPADRILISATHTHSAPPVMGALGTDLDAVYADLMRARLVNVIEAAAERLQPAKIGWAVRDDAEHTHCRRWILRSDKMRKDPFGGLTVRANMHPGYQNPDFIGPAGPVDPGLTVLAVQSRDGKPMAFLANYSMHYVGSDPGVSPDYYGPFVKNIRRLLGIPEQDGGFVAMMSQGTSGDQHWMDYSQPKREMNCSVYAELLAKKAYEAYRQIRYRNWVPVRMQERNLTFARRVPDEQRLAWARRIFADVPEGKPRNQAEVYAREQILISQEPNRELKLQAIRIGDLGIAAFPTEVFAITGLKIKRQSPLQPTFNIELANGAEGYIPPPEQHRLGGYTTWPARTAGLEVNAEPKIVEAMLDSLERVSGRPRRPITWHHGAYARKILAAHPLAYYRGEEIAGSSALDSTQNKNHGEYKGFVALHLEGVPFAGSSSGAPINRSPQYAGGHMRAKPDILGEEYGVAMWFWNGLPADARSVTGYLFTRAGDRLGIGGTSGASGKLFFNTGDKIFKGTAEVSPKAWYFLVLNRGKKDVRIYLNASPIPEVAGEVPAPNRAGGITIAASGDEQAAFEGKIDEVAIFRRCLTAGEIAALYRLGIANMPKKRE